FVLNRLSRGTPSGCLVGEGLHVHQLRATLMAEVGIIGILLLTLPTHRHGVAAYHTPKWKRG
ncbi:MAG: hypothetical protein CCU26_12635, partial [Nitrospira sp. UW-LDO-01]